MWTDAVVKDMFRGNQGDTKKLAAQFNGMMRPGATDDRYALPLANEADADTDMVYVAHGPAVRGRFDVQKSLALGVPNGPDRGRLTRGETIEVNDPNAPGGKRVIRPEDCLVGGNPGAVLIIVQCSDHNLEGLVSHEAFQPYQGEDGQREHDVRTVVHEVSKEVWEDERYQEWVARFGEATQHLVVEKNRAGPIHFDASAWQCLRLNLIDPSMFPVPHFDEVNPQPEWKFPPNAQRLVPGLVTGMYPPKPPTIPPPGEKARQPFPTAHAQLGAARQSIRDELPEFAAACSAAQEVIAAEEKKRTVQPGPGDDIVVTTLGTGSAIPSKYRNVSATHIDVPGLGGILLDCGEGTLGQLRRRYGPKLKDVLANLRMIFVSHMHADHHLGLTTILSERFRLGIESPLYLLAPLPIALQLSETAAWQAGVPRHALENVKYLNINRLKRGWTANELSRHEAQVQESESDGAVSDTAVRAEAAFATDVAAGVRKWPFHNFARSHPDQNARSRAILSSLFKDLDISALRTPFVAHRGAAYGLCLSHRSGWKLAYSGDTKPCAAFVEAGRGATIMIHEATLEDEKPDVAEAKGHSTFGQAIDVGREMGAKFVILNHFSQRYPKVPKLASESSEAASEGAQRPDVAISFDLMSLRAADTWKMQHYMDAVGLMYASEAAEEGAAEATEETEGAEELTGKAKAKANKERQRAAQKAAQARKKAAAVEQEGAGEGQQKKRGSDVSDSEVKAAKSGKKQKK